jgi:hypothetical protein
MTTLVGNALLADHVASLEQRVAELQAYFSHLLADYSLAATTTTADNQLNVSTVAATDNGDSMMFVSAEDIQAMEVGAEVVVTAEENEMSSPEKSTVSPSSVKTTGGRRRRRTKKQARLQQHISQKGDGGSDVIIINSSSNSLEPISVDMGNGAVRLRLRN